MMLKELREKVYEANMDLPRHGLVVFTWGNASEYDPESGLFVIKPSGVDYDELSPENMVVCDLDGNRVEGEMNPSSDTLTHAWIYKNWADKGVKGCVHTHSAAAVAWAQAGRDLPAYGTTHADYFYGPVPCMRGLTEDEIEEAYELNTGKVIVAGFEERGIDPIAVPAVLVRNHGPFTWGKDAARHRDPLGPLRPGPAVPAGQALPAQARPQRLLRPGRRALAAACARALPAPRSRD